MSFNFDGMIYTRPYKAEISKKPSENVVFCSYFDRKMSAGFSSFSEPCLCANHLPIRGTRNFYTSEPPPLPFPPFLQNFAPIKRKRLSKERVREFIAIRGKLKNATRIRGSYEKVTKITLFSDLAAMKKSLKSSFSL